MTINANIEMQGDILIKFYNKSKSAKGFTKALATLHDALTRVKIASKFPYMPLFRFSFHTSFVTERLTLKSKELDGVFAGPLPTNKYFPAEMEVSLQFEIKEKVVVKKRRSSKSSTFNNKPRETVLIPIEEKKNKS